MQKCERERNQPADRNCQSRLDSSGENHEGSADYLDCWGKDISLGKDWNRCVRLCGVRVL